MIKDRLRVDSLPQPEAKIKREDLKSVSRDQWEVAMAPLDTVSIERKANYKHIDSTVRDIRLRGDDRIISQVHTFANGSQSYCLMLCLIPD